MTTKEAKKIFETLPKKTRDKLNSNDRLIIEELFIEISNKLFKLGLNLGKKLK